MISQIFQYLTKKQINNSITLLPEKSPEELFLEQKNVSKIAVYLYNSMNIANRPDYIEYRDLIEKNMNDWIWKQKKPADDTDQNYPFYIMKRYNQDFITDHSYLIKKPNITYMQNPKISSYNNSNTLNYGESKDNFYNIKPDNLFKDKFLITKRNEDGSIDKSYKKGGEMMPWDYQNWDVWKKEETYADFDFEKFRSFRDRYGYAGNYIPRNVDRDPESFGLTHRDPMRASLSDTPRAYDNSDYFKAKGIYNKK